MVKRLINPSDEGPVRDKKLDEVVAALVELKLTAGLQKVKKNVTQMQAAVLEINYLLEFIGRC